MGPNPTEPAICRSKYIGPNNFVDELALCPCVLTSNSDFPLDTGFRSKIIYIIHTKDDKSWNEEQKTEFNAFMNKGSSLLRIVGDFIGTYVLDNQEVLLKKNPEECDWKETAQIVYEELYKFVGLEIPGWIDQFVEEADITEAAIQEASETSYFEIRGFFVKAINDAYRTDPIIETDSYGKPIWPAADVNLQSKLNRCLTQGLITYLHQKPDEIIITHDVVKELKKAKISNISTMPELSKEIKEFEYKPVWLEDRTVKAICGPYQKFINFLGCKFGDG